MDKLKLKKIQAYNPSDLAQNDNLFGLPFTTEESEVVVVPMPWEVTVSYRAGTARGPETMRDASGQVDLFLADMPDAWKAGISMLPISPEWLTKNKKLRGLAEKCIDHLENGGKPTDAKVKKYYEAVNSGSAELNDWMERETSKWLKKEKAVCVLGGEHSVSLGFMRALAKEYPKYSILHIDAHADFRQAFEGFEYSHASIQYNASKIPNVDRQVLVGIRDYSHQEDRRIQESKGKIVAFPDLDIKRRGYEGETWKRMCQDIIKPLSKNVYISYDIDALDPSLCPHTGTPVPGGLEFEQVFYLVEALIQSGRKIIGFDLCEVAPGENDDWDSIVGVRTLYRLANLMAKSQGRLS